ncbi:hypothetical protein B0H19DRAFT_1371306 [Mycena capillaripes]|nr:hypothetical protein B0H19DRAFT_1371306 [Mycena capillaripes]
MNLPVLMLHVFWTVLLCTAQVRGFAFTNLGPITFGSIVTVSWTLNATDDYSQICVLELSNNDKPKEQFVVGNFALVAMQYVFNFTNSTVLAPMVMSPGRNYSWAVFGGHGGGGPLEFVSDTFELRAPASPQSSTTSPQSSTASPQISTTSDSSNTPSSPSPPHKNKSNPTKLIVGIVIGVLAFFGLLAAAVVLLRRHNSRHDPERREALEAVSAGRIDAFKEQPTSLTSNDTSSNLGFSTVRKLTSTASMDSGKAARRQAHLAAQMKAIRTEMDELALLDASTGGNLGGITADHAPRQEDAHTTAQVSRLEARIRELEAQAMSQFAMGLSDEPPPGYRESITVLSEKPA